MLEATPIQTQLTCVRDDPMRVLVVGAGVAGVTFAQILRRNGLHPVLVERARHGGDNGYMLALMPMVDPVLADLGLTGEYRRRSVDLRRYRIRNRVGVPIREYAMQDLLSRFGDYRGISRGDLLDVLGAGGGALSYGTTVTALDQGGDTVRATLDGPAGPVTGEFDLVVAADGLHSTTRGLVLDPSDVATYDSGWGGWVAWAEPDDAADLGEELWGTGFFVGTYPVRGRLGVIVLGARSDTAAGPKPFVARITDEVAVSDARLRSALDAVARDDPAYYWPLRDCRAARWSVGRVALLGDAAAGFLPTAGIGAGMAMESAWVLAGHVLAGPRGRTATGRTATGRTATGRLGGRGGPCPPGVRAGPAATGRGGTGQLPDAGAADVPSQPGSGRPPRHGCAVRHAGDGPSSHPHAARGGTAARVTACVAWAAWVAAGSARVAPRWVTPGQQRPIRCEVALVAPRWTWTG